MKKLLAVLLFAVSVANADLGVVVSQSGTVIAKEVYAGDTSGVATALSSRQQADPTLTFVTYSLPDSAFTAVVVPVNQVQFRNDAISLLLNDPSANPKTMRAILLVIRDEINLLRQRDRDRSVDVAAATTLADLKARWALRPSLDDRTSAQGKAAVQARLSSGEAD